VLEPKYPKEVLEDRILEVLLESAIEEGL